MARHIYRLDDDQGHSAAGPYNPLAGVTVRRAHAERTRRTLYRSDGSVAGTEDRQTLTLDTDSSRGPLYTARQLGRLSSPIWRLLYLVRQAFYAFVGAAFLIAGSAILLSVVMDLTHSAGLAILAEAIFWGVCYLISTRS